MREKIKIFEFFENKIIETKIKFKFIKSIK